jgi:hypothetical protein
VARKQRKKLPRKKTESELAWERIKGKYPHCSGSYPECPNDIQDKDNPPGECRLCPVYMEWKK